MPDTAQDEDGGREERLTRRTAQSGTTRRGTTGGINSVFGAAAIEEIVRVVNPHALGLEPVSDRKFVARHGDGFKIVEIPAFKGAAYGLRWGVGLTYVPLALRRPLRFGRTIKSSRLSLWWGSERDSRAPNLRYIQTFDGMQGLRDGTAAVWDRCQQAVLAFWDETVDLPGVLARAIHQNSLPASKIYLPNAGVVAALTAARMGDESQARQLASQAPIRDSDAELLRELTDRYLLQTR